jgi:hypothetical protein
LIGMARSAADGWAGVQGIVQLIGKPT